MTIVLGHDGISDQIGIVYLVPGHTNVAYLVPGRTGIAYLEPV